MKIFIATCVRLTKVKDKLYLTAPFASILMRYYKEFGAVTLCTRVIDAEVPDKKLVDVTHIIETLVPLKKLTDVLKPHIKKQIEEELSKCELLIARVNSVVAVKVADIAKKLKKPYCTEVVACAWDSLWNHSIKGKIVAPYMFLKMKHVVKNADYASYVSEFFLQGRYPTGGKMLACSDVYLKTFDKDILHKRLERINNRFEKITLGTVAAVNVRYKGQQYVIEAISRLKKEGYKIKYKLVGGGDNRFLKKIAKKYGVLENIEFLGSLSHDKVFEFMDNIDIYIQPSLAESHGRVLVEAMSRACPIMGAATGGIPELVNDKYIFKRRRVNDICEKIKCMLAGDELIKEAMRSFERAKDFEKEKLDTKRNGFYKMVKEEIKK